MPIGQRCPDRSPFSSCDQDLHRFGEAMLELFGNPFVACPPLTSLKKSGSESPAMREHRILGGYDLPPGSLD
jgi:hypothetical protein